MLAVPIRGWQRVGVAALLTIPLVLVVLSIMPGLLVSVFLSDARREYTLKLIAHIVAWARVINALPPATHVAGDSAVIGAAACPADGHPIHGTAA